MEVITEKSTKKEILTAYLQQQGKIEEFEQNLKYLTELKAEIMETEPSVAVVIPYVKNLAQGNELQLALRSWDKHFKDNFHIVIIGDREEWMSDDLDVIECEREGAVTEIDTAIKMLKAIESGLVSDKFILAYDDIYLVSPCRTSDFEILKTIGRLNPPFSDRRFGRNLQDTFDVLTEAGASKWNYSTHTPYVLEKDKLKFLIDYFQLNERALIWNTLYFNYYYPDFVPFRLDLERDNIKIGVYRQDANFKKLKELLPKKKLVNNSNAGWSDELSEIINGLFPDKCRFEK